MWVLWSPNIVKENKKNPFPEIEEKWKRMTFGDTFVFSHSVRLNERFFCSSMSCRQKSENELKKKNWRLKQNQEGKVED